MKEDKWTTAVIYAVGSVLKLGVWSASAASAVRGRDIMEPREPPSPAGQYILPHTPISPEVTSQRTHPSDDVARSSVFLRRRVMQPRVPRRGDDQDDTYRAKQSSSPKLALAEKSREKNGVASPAGNPDGVPRFQGC